MAPKAKPPSREAQAAATNEQDPTEVDEEGPGTAAFCLEVSACSNLPCELETCVAFSGLCKEKRSQPAAASSAPSEWVFEKDKFIRPLGQELYDDLASRTLIIRLHDAANDGAVIGEAPLSLLPLLHDSTQVSAELQLKLTEAYFMKWFPDLESAEAEASAAKAKAKAKPADKEPEKDEKKDAWVPPFTPEPTTITVRVSVADLVGPEEDRDNWTTLTLRCRGAFALPGRLTALGLAGGIDDLEAHQMKYRAVVFGESLGEGALARPPEEPLPPRPPSSPEGEAEEVDPMAGLSEAEWREVQERKQLSVQFSGGEKIVKYRGAAFVRQFRAMLNEAGGVWLYFDPEEKPPPDPKKPNLPEVPALARHYTGKAWLDLTSLIHPGERATQACCSLVSVGATEETAQEPTLESSRAYVRLALELSHDLTPPGSKESQAPMERLVLPHEGLNKFPASGDAAAMYREVVERSFEVLRRDGVGGIDAGVPGVVQALKKAGSYEEVKEDFRSNIIRVLRERLRKDAGAVPGRAPSHEEREALISSTFTYLKSAMAETLDELRKTTVVPAVATAAAGATEVVAEPVAGDRTDKPAGGGRNGSLAALSSSKSPPGGGTPEGGTSPHTTTGHLTGGAEFMEAGTAEALAESARVRRAREALDAVTQIGERCQRLAYEAEMVGHWDRAAELIQSRLLLDAYKNEPKEWIAYAKFCARSRGRQAAAEEALMQAVRLLAENAVPQSNEIHVEVDLMLACLLLDRGRHDTAIRVFRNWHDKDIAEPMFNFLLGLALYLSGEEAPVWKPLLEAVSKPRDWFQGMPDDKSVAAKLGALRKTSGALDVMPYVACLERLLDFGLPSLVFTFLDQNAVLPPETLAVEPLALLDAKAAALDRDFTAGAARLQPLITSGGASREAFRLAGECHFQLQDYDRALQVLHHALSSKEEKFEEPSVYIRLGSVLLVKKRWKQARDAFLRSISYMPTAEAWSGVAYAEYRSDELQMCYEALCEANLLDNERADVWAQLSLVHLRLENWDSADNCARHCLSHQPDCEELLLDVAVEYTRRERQPAVAEAMCRSALQLRDTGPGHGALAEALVAQGRLEKAVLEFQVALRLLADQPDQRKPIFEKAVKVCEELGDPPLLEALHAVQKLADEEHGMRARAATDS